MSALTKRTIFSVSWGDPKVAANPNSNAAHTPL